MAADQPQVLDEDWSLLCQFLPEGWQRQAWITGAVRRLRGLDGPESLLRILFIHLAAGYSLAETSVRARRAGLGQLSAVAIFKRLQAAEDWLRWLAVEERRLLTRESPASIRRLRAVDATTVSEPGNTGTDWRLHYAINLQDLQCDFFELTDASGGETWQRVPIIPGDVMLGDRGYATPPGVAHVIGSGGDVVVRLNRQSLPLYDSAGRRIKVLDAVSPLRVLETLDLPAFVHPQQLPAISGRLIAIRRSAEATELVRRQLLREASKKQRNVSAEALTAAAYFFLWTSLGSGLSASQVLAFYRCRWQIELSFKRMKSILGLGHLPKKDAASCRAWLHGKLVISLLIERLIQTATTFSPWGYKLPDGLRDRPLSLAPG